MVIGATEDEWVRAAIKDDRLVAAILIGFTEDQQTIPACWGRRLPRSRPATDRDNLAMAERRKRMEGECSYRCSPATPLSWSGGTSTASPSTLDTGYEDATSLYPLSTKSKVQESISAETRQSKKRKENGSSKERSGTQRIAKKHIVSDSERTAYCFDLNLMPPEEEIIQEGLIHKRR